MITRKRHEEIVRKKVKAARQQAFQEAKLREQLRQQEEELLKLKTKLWHMQNDIDTIKDELDEVKGQAADNVKFKGFYAGKNGGCMEVHPSNPVFTVDLTGEMPCSCTGCQHDNEEAEEEAPSEE